MFTLQKTVSLKRLATITELNATTATTIDQGWDAGGTRYLETTIATPKSVLDFFDVDDDITVELTLNSTIFSNTLEVRILRGYRFIPFKIETIHGGEYPRPLFYCVNYDFGFDDITPFMIELNRYFTTAGFGGHDLRQIATDVFEAATTDLEPIIGAVFELERLDAVEVMADEDEQNDCFISFDPYDLLHETIVATYGGLIITWNGSATFNVYNGNNLEQQLVCVDCFTNYDVKNLEDAVEAACDWLVTELFEGVEV